MTKTCQYSPCGEPFTRPAGVTNQAWTNMRYCPDGDCRIMAKRAMCKASRDKLKRFQYKPSYEPVDSLRSADNPIPDRIRAGVIQRRMRGCMGGIIG